MASNNSILLPRRRGTRDKYNIWQKHKRTSAIEFGGVIMSFSTPGKKKKTGLNPIQTTYQGHHM